MTVEAKDDFDAAFVQFSAPEEKKTVEAATTDQGAGDGTTDQGGTVADADSGAGDTGSTDGDAGGVEGTDAAEAAAEGGEGGDAEVTGGEEAADATGEADAGAADASTEAKPADEADDILQRLAKVIKEAPTEEKKSATEETTATEEQPLYTDDEKAFLEEYGKEWGDVSRGEALKRREEHHELVKYVFSEIAEYLAPLRQTIDALATNAHISALEQKIGKFDDKLGDELDGWIETQPDYLQTAYKQVIEKGNANQVADLVTRYRKETGKSAGAPAKAGKKDAELSETAKKAAASLAPVSTKRSVVEQQDDPNDFGAAWSKFIDSV